MTDTQWLLDLVEEATPQQDHGYLVEDSQTLHAQDQLSDLAPDLARLCVEMANWIDDGVGGMDEGKKLLARFAELKP